MKTSLEERKTLRNIFIYNNFGWRLLIGFFFLICLFVYFHFREVRVEVLDLNSVAPKYIVAQVDFEFSDDEATFIARQKAFMDISSIYRIDEKEIRQAGHDFEKHLIHNQNWRHLPSVSYLVLNESADTFEDLLIRARFVDTKTYNKMKNLNLDVKNYVIFNAKTKQPIYALSNDYINLFSKRLLFQSENTPESTINFITNYFAQYKYKLAIDHLAQSKLRKKIEKDISEKFTKIAAGEQIIAQDEKVTHRHIAMIQAMKQALRQTRNIFEPLTIIGNIILAFVFMILTVLYFKIEQPKLMQSLKKVSLIVTVLILTLLFAKIIEFILLQSTSFILEAVRYPIIVPFAALLFSILFNSRIALFFSTFLSIILGVTLAVDHAAFLVVNLVTSLIVIISTRSLSKRTEVFEVCGKCLLGVIPIILASSFINNRLWNLSLVTNIISSLIFLLIIGILVVGLLPVLESSFNVMTDITLMEFMDPSNELLRRLTLEIPGTYQHSLVLGNLSEAAALAINADGLFCRVATMYHDIGKLNNPNYFTENQGLGAVNIHQLLTPLESAQVIISHVRDGEMLARKYRLPQPFIDIIKEHHGTTLVYYFYHKEVELKDNDPSKVDANAFRYPGPKPKSKESAIIMIADGVEAASRSLEVVNEKTLTEMINRLINEKTQDGQFDDCCLTFEELKIVKETLIRTLVLTRHVRIKYPEKMKLLKV